MTSPIESGSGAVASRMVGQPPRPPLGGFEAQTARMTPAPQRETGSVAPPVIDCAVTSLTEKQVGQLLQMKVSTLRAWRLSGKGPNFLRYGSAVRYLRSDVDRFIENSRVAPARALG